MTSVEIHWAAKDLRIDTSGRNLAALYTGPGWFFHTARLDGTSCNMVSLLLQKYGKNAPGASAIPKLLFEPIEVVPKLGDTTCHGELVGKENSPDRDPGSQEKVKVSQGNSFVRMACESALRSSAESRSSSSSCRRLSRR